jgi:hypothetical protein
VIVGAASDKGRSWFTGRAVSGDASAGRDTNIGVEESVVASSFAAAIRVLSSALTGFGITGVMVTVSEGVVCMSATRNPWEAESMLVSITEETSSPLRVSADSFLWWS